MKCKNKRLWHALLEFNILAPITMWWTGVTVARICFITDADRSRFVDALADRCETFSVKLISYVLMANHFHLLVQTADGNLSEFMRRFLVTTG